MSAQDQYTVKVPGGLAFSEFKGYEAWQAISISRNERRSLNRRQSRDDRRLPGRHSRQRQACSGRGRCEDPLEAETQPVFADTTVPGELVNVDFMVKDRRGSRTAAAGDMPCSTTTPRPIRSARHHGGTPPQGNDAKSGSRATRERRREITFLRIREALNDKAAQTRPGV